jgi:two-component system chemotaxis response regulator CheY
MTMHWDLSTVSFLVIDDNMHMRSILRSVLGGFGARHIFEASDGADGLEVVLDRSPDFILCDWMMKPLSGSEFIRTLRAERDKLLSTLPVVVISAHSHKSTVLEAVNLGIHGFIAKPVSPAVLYRHITEILHKQALHGRTKGILFNSASTDRRSRNRIDDQSSVAAAPASETTAVMIDMALI